MSSSSTPTQLKRKLPIKRNPSLTPKLEPNRYPNPNPLASTDDEDLDDLTTDPSLHATSANPPFKFVRVWSESDEIRFLQGLLACFNQNLLFPRDLNLFYDRFSESMPQPYTRSQLSEKLRRLKKKFRVMSGRIARGQDPARLAPHDRDLLHLSTRLWHPSYSATSPFSAVTEAGDEGSSGNKRRRPNPTPRGAPVDVGHSETMLLLDVKDEILGDVEINNLIDEVKIEAAEDVPTGFVKQEEVPVGGFGVRGLSGIMVRSVLDVFDGCVEEARASLGGLDGGSELERRWRELRIAEMDLLARRMRLVAENGVRE